MTAARIIALADGLRPNQYTEADKLRWLSRLDGQLYLELMAAYGEPGEAPAESYTAETRLLAPSPWAEELYCAYLFSQFDLHNGEIEKYNQSATLFAAARRQYADWYNRTHRATGLSGFRF